MVIVAAATLFPVTGGLVIAFLLWFTEHTARRSQAMRTQMAPRLRALTQLRLDKDPYVGPPAVRHHQDI